MLTTAYLALGSNLEDRYEHLKAAISRLEGAEGCQVAEVSPAIETQAVGGSSNQPRFLNMALRLETSLSSFALLDLLQLIERERGRTRELRWGPRTLDIDILMFGDQIVRSERLILPHPRMAIRMFVLEPLSRIAPDVVDPVTKRTISELVANCERRPSVVDLLGWNDFAPDLRIALTGELDSRDWIIVDSLESKPDEQFPPTLQILWKQALVGFQSDNRIWPPSVTIDSDQLEWVVSETLAACDATRSHLR